MSARWHLTTHEDPKVLLRFTRTDNSRLRFLACKDKDLPPDLVARIATDSESDVRRAAAGHARLPAESLPLCWPTRTRSG